MSADCFARTISGIHHFSSISSCHFQAPFSKTKPSAFVSGWHNVDGRVVLRWVIQRWELFDSQSESSKADAASIAAASATASTATVDRDSPAELWWGQQAPAVHPDTEPEDQREDARQSETSARKFVEFATKLAAELDPIRSATSFSWWWWESFDSIPIDSFSLTFHSLIRRHAVDHDPVCDSKGKLNAGNYHEKDSNQAADRQD